MENYKLSSYYAGGTHAGNSTKQVHILWNEDLECGVVYHSSIKTGKITKMWLQFGSGKNLSVIPIDKNTKSEDAVLMVEQTYSVIKKLSK